MTCAPHAPNATSAAAPIPALAPVIRTIWFLNSSLSIGFLCKRFLFSAPWPPLSTRDARSNTSYDGLRRKRHALAELRKSHQDRPRVPLRIAPRSLVDPDWITGQSVPFPRRSLAPLQCRPHRRPYRVPHRHRFLRPPLRAEGSGPCHSRRGKPAPFRPDRQVARCPPHAAANRRPALRLRRRICRSRRQRDRKSTRLNSSHLGI